MQAQLLCDCIEFLYPRVALCSSEKLMKFFEAMPACKGLRHLDSPAFSAAAPSETNTAADIFMYNESECLLAVGGGIRMA